MDDRLITPDRIRQLNDDELQRLANAAWYDQDIRLSWLCQTELMRRAKEREALTK